MRTSPTQLPRYEELQALLAAEVPREVPKEKRDTHYVDYSVLVDLLNTFGLPSELFTKKIDDLAEFMTDEALELINGLVDKVLEGQDSPENQRLFDALFDYLAEDDEPQQADVIFVYGSKKTFRVEKAIDLYKQGLAPRIMISGKGPFYEGDQVAKPEAEVLGRFAVEQGVPEAALILEKESISMPDNVKRSLNMLEQEGVPHKRIIIVCSAFNQRRGWAYFSKMSAVGTELIRANVRKATQDFTRDGWYRSEVGTKVIIKEFFGLRVSEILNTA